MPKSVLSVRIENAVMTSIDEAAEYLSKTRSELVEEILVQFFAKNLQQERIELTKSRNPENE